MKHYLQSLFLYSSDCRAHLYVLSDLALNSAEILSNIDGKCFSKADIISRENI